MLQSASFSSFRGRDLLLRATEEYHQFMVTDFQQRESLRRSSPDGLAAHQLSRLNQLLDAILPENRFYQEKYASIKLPLESLDQLESLPFTLKSELVEQTEQPGFAANLTYPIDRYTRFHRTSGTKGRPVVVLDTLEDWQWWMGCWQYVLDAAGIESDDRVLMAFSFGPFIGFWSANDAVAYRGSLVIPTGGMSTVARLELIRTMNVTTLFCTPSYAIHMAQTAGENQMTPSDLGLQKIVVAGEPGGSVPAIREQIETMWNARVIDHSGASEVGPWGFGDPLARGLYINEAEFIAEFISVESGNFADQGELSELVLTCLGRHGSPIIRYRTGDLVKPVWDDEQSCRFVLLEGGVLGRSDDMMIIRGVNIFPSSIEQILRSFPEIVEYRMTAFKNGAMDALRIDIEDRLEEPGRVAEELRLRLGLNIDVKCVEIGTLPRFELKGKRFVDQR